MPVMNTPFGLMVMTALVFAIVCKGAQAQRQPPQPSPVAEARKNVLEAQQELAKAQQALKDLRARLLPGFEASPHWQDATMRRKEAQAAYEAAA